MSALGTGITGGEPLMKLDLMLHYIRLLKETFGEEHHIHLYTGIAPSQYPDAAKGCRAGRDQVPPARRGLG